MIICTGDIVQKKEKQSTNSKTRSTDKCLDRVRNIVAQIKNLKVNDACEIRNNKFEITFRENNCDKSFCQ